MKKYAVLGCEVTRDVIWHVHAVGCADIKRMERKGWHTTVDELDLTDEEQVMNVLDPDELGYTIDDVRVHPCTRDRVSPKAGTRHPRNHQDREVATAELTKRLSRTTRANNGKAQDAANAKADAIIQGIIDKIISERGVDSIGEDDRWEDERRDGVDDYTYDLAVEVRKMREGGTAWWRIAHDLYLPGHGPSAAQGKSGAAYARRLWQRAWGLTYTNGEKAPRETRAVRQERAFTREHRPYFAEDAKDMDIIKKILGQKLTWVARLADRYDGVIISEQEAYVHPDARTIKISEGPQGRFVEFWETLDAAQLKVDPRMAIAKTGPRRAVYLNRIEKVGA